MAATGEEDVSALSERVDKLSVSATDDEVVSKGVENGADGNAKTCEPRLWGFETRELYKLALNFYKGEYLTVCQRDFSRPLRYDLIRLIE